MEASTRTLEPMLRSGVSPQVAALLRTVAAQLEPQADVVAAAMLAAYAEEIPAYRAVSDVSLLDDVRAVSAAVVRVWLTVMSTGEPVDEVLLAPLTDGARRRAAQGVDMESMLRAYRIGIRVMWAEIVGSPAWHGRALLHAMGSVATWALDFADRTCTAVAAAYLDEAASVARERAHRRSGLLNLLLAGPDADRRFGPDELDQAHLVVVAKVGNDLPLDALELVGQHLERSLDAALWTVRHCSVIAAVPAPSGYDRDQLRARLLRLSCTDNVYAFGIGNTAIDSGETRQSYAEAADALKIGHRTASLIGPVYDYRDLAPLISLLEDPERARRFSRSTLECLAPFADRKWALPTLEAYLVRQGRLKEIAAALGIHQSTAKYRLAELRTALDPLVGDGERATSMLLALRVHQHFAAEAPPTGAG